MLEKIAVLPSGLVMVKIAVANREMAAMSMTHLFLYRLWASFFFRS